MRAALPVPRRFSLALRVARRVNAVRGMSTALAAFRMVWSTGGIGQGFASGAGGYGSASRYGMYGTLPGTQTDWVRVVGDPTLNAAVAICLNWIKRQLPEPRFCVKRRKRDGTEVEVPNHPLTKLLKKPNPWYDGASLMTANAASYLVSGQGYYLRARGAGGYGQTLWLWFIPYWELQPIWPTDGSEFITNYLYRPSGRGVGYEIEPQWVVHHRADLNPYNQGRTASPTLFPLLPAIASDTQADAYWYAILQNMGVPSVYIGPESKEDALNETEVNDLTERWVEKFTHEGRGKPFVSELPIKVEKLGLSPQELALGDGRDGPEKRVAAILGVTRTLVGLGESKGFDNGGQMDAARRGAYEDCIIPMLRRFCLTWDDELLPEYQTSANEFCDFDYTKVKCLQDDQDKLSARWANLYQKGVSTRDEARAPIGLKPVAELPKQQQDQTPPPAGNAGDSGAGADGGDSGNGGDGGSGGEGPPGS